MIILRRHQLVSELRKILRQVNRESRTVGGAYGAGISLAEAHVLFELAANATSGASTGPSEIAAALHLSKLQVSRLVAGLITAKLVSSSKGSASDKRTKQLSLTNLGKETFAEIQNAASARVSAQSACLSREESLRFNQLVDLHSQGTDTAIVHAFPGEPALLAPLRRLTRGLRLLAPHPIESIKLSNLDIQLLYELQATPEGSFPSALADSFGLPLNTVSSALTRLTRLKLLRVGATTSDKRKKTIRLSLEGAHKVREIEKLACAALASSLRHLSDGDIREYVKLWDIFRGSKTLAGSTPVKAEVPSSREVAHTAWSVSSLESEDALISARRLLVASLDRGLHYLTLPTSLAHPTSRVFGVYVGSHLEAVFQFSERMGTAEGTRELDLDHIASMPHTRSGGYALGEVLQHVLVLLHEQNFSFVEINSRTLHPEDVRELQLQFGEHLRLPTSTGQTSHDSPFKL